jgi:hypothetical protein
MAGKSVFAAVALIALMPMAVFGEPFRSIDECLEVDVDPGSLPRSLPGQLAVSPCPDCEPILFQLDDRTRFFVGKQVVSMTVAHQYARRADRLVQVCHDKDKRVTRVLVSGSIDTNDAPR